jgi:CubicO group peptidase (beta-lactamase class C family)
MRSPARLAKALVLAGALALTAGPAYAKDAVIYPGATWAKATPAEVGMDADTLAKARAYALTGGGSGYVTRHGKLVLSWGDPRRRYDLKSSTKSIGVTSLGLALADGKMALDDRAVKYQPSLGTPPASNEKTGWIGKITLRHLATQTAGFEKPGGYGKLLFEPGTKWFYSDAGPNWLAECVTLAYKRDVRDLMFDRVFTPLGIKHDDLTWRNNAYRPHKIDGIPRREFGSGVHANVNAMARLGYLYLREGKWRGKQLLPADFVRAARAPVKGVVGLPEHGSGDHGNASDHYGLLWWNNGDGTLEGVPRDAYWSWGLYDSLILVIPSLDIVCSRAGKSWKRKKGADHYDVLAPFFGPIVASVRDGKRGRAPYPASPVIAGIEWAPPETIVRRAPGGDNWPITWGDDRLYTAYGDGRGFVPHVPRKLSMGLATVAGFPPDFRGTNLRSPSGEDVGDGPRGKKASGLLMVDGVLYLWARNADNSQLAWSADRGKTWTWADWKFTTSFGCPTFLNFGKDYAGARDGFVYVYSPDAETAYDAADRMVLARVPKDKIRDRSAYEFFAGRGSGGEPRWTRDVRERGAVFEHAGKCHRGGISYNAGLKRYLWCQVLPPKKGERGPRFEGGFGIYDGPEPWGPWTTAYFTEKWDVGPGESSCFPTRWMSADGKVLYLVFSGNDAFSVRKATLTTRP